MAVITVKDLTVKYEHITALDHVSFDVKANEFMGIIGPNGGGKTTLVKTILGLLEPIVGEVEIAKNQIIGYVPQSTTFDKHFPITVMDVVLTGHLPTKFRLLHRFKGHDYDHATVVMEQLGIAHLAKRQIGKLSGGQMQRVLIARALMNHPTILILDEPTASVDEVSKREIYDMLSKLNKEMNMTILMITHDTTMIWHYLDRCVYINKTAHLHEHVLEGGKTTEASEICPIEWYVEGERIQKELEGGKKL